MPKREMSKEEYEAQQWPYRFSVMSPQDMAQEFKHKTIVDTEEEEKRREKLDKLHLKLMAKINEKIQKNLTKRQKEVIELFLISKKQEHMGAILLITQEAVHSRLSIAFKRLRKECAKDPEIQEIKKQIRKA
jgi:DNA-directed RNA polymerase specialized sigma24 family protein